ncbi:hypothetical protein [Anaeromyxobacter soli]|uniref:hypothetical protein n=1 Tax=Anaeromyxobacter soli TaxID=2922725 RepID=UPI001FAFD6B2|nr:hypothetical protein [Anaeromyxobacter sp. SG29]
MPDDLMPAMRDLLNQFSQVSRDSFSHRRGSSEAREYADQIERGYGSDADARVRREIALICAWLRNP